MKSPLGEISCPHHVINLDHWLVAGTCRAFERPKLDVSLYQWICKFATNQSLRIKNSVLWIPGNLILRSITNETFGVGESNIRGSGTVALVICDDLNTIILPHTHTRIRGAKVNANCNFLGHPM